ncbi:MAG: DNA repair protein RecN [Muribaculaceae bacterium]|nr:DNA repair protein RecN [Muribaculaceae bacterium]
MLSKLYISNYALISELEIDFDDHLTVVTGETGAGKSIILGALSLILGERADVRVMGTASSKTVVEATFFHHDNSLAGMLALADVDQDEEGEYLLRREIHANGRSRAFVNDTPVPLSTLRDVATRLVDIHSQHGNMLLSKPQFQLSVLDNLAQNQGLLADYTSVFSQYRKTQAQLERLITEDSDARKEQDYILFQLNQLQTLALKPDEDAALEATQQRLSNAADIKQLLWEANDVITNEQTALVERIKSAANRMISVAGNIPEIEEIGERLQAVAIELTDLAQTLDGVQEDFTLDPEKLLEVEQRLNEIYELERKHGVQSVNQLIDIQNGYEGRLHKIDDNQERIAALTRQRDSLLDQASVCAKKLTVARRAAAKEFENLLVPQAQKLGLKNLRFEVQVKEVPLGATGADAVDFLVSFNKNQPMQHLKEAASGGEMSRLMLCIKAIVAQRMNLPTIIFDEVDTGISGDIANMAGEMMGQISHAIQVLAITHLPQVASHGSHHLKVYKIENEKGSETVVKMLDPEEHVMEVARMLSGRSLNEAAIANARALIAQNQM